jgi:hypothetical protein
LRHIAALSVVPDGSAVALLQELRRALEEHTSAVTSPWLITAGKFSDVFFPQPFKRFQLTGETPCIQDIAISLEACDRFPSAISAPASTDVVQLFIEDLLSRDTRVPERCFKPVFIVGCGRSGTTLLTRLLACHPLVVDINEARAVWLALPCLDIWSVASELRGGRLDWPETLKLDDEQRETLRRSFLIAVLSSPDLRVRLARTRDRASLLEALQSVVLAEKLPENAFRIAMLVQLFPECKVVHLFRQKAAVVRSISKFSFSAWYGPTGYKWKQLQALQLKQHSSLPPPVASTMANCAEVEWTLTQQYVEAAAALLPGKLLHIGFDDLVLDTISTWHKILSFTELPALDLSELPALQALLPTVQREKALPVR